MKQWISPEINVLDIKDTSWGCHGGWVNNGSWHHGGWNGNVGGNNPLPPGQDDIGGHIPLVDRLVYMVPSAIVR